MDVATLAVLWAGLIAFAILVYVLLDGFDLGVGILFGTTGNEAFRQRMMAAIAPVWDGNETWLILVGASLFGAFPVVYAIFLSAFYLPVTLLLFALIFRGVAFEFRDRTRRLRWLWDGGFFVGSLIAAFVQGAAIGAMIEELPIVDGRYAGGSFTWISAFSILCGVGLVVGYALLGASWLVLKTEGALRAWAYRRVGWLVSGVLLFVGVALVVVIATDLRVMRRWQEFPWLGILPAVGAFAALVLLHASRTQRRDGLPFAMSAVLFLVAFLALAGSFWPYMVPFSLTVHDAAAPLASLTFLFYGAGLVVFPIVLLYTLGCYWIFRGKVGEEAKYR